MKREKKDIKKDRDTKQRRSAKSAGCNLKNLSDGHSAETTPTANSGMPGIEFNPKATLVK